MHSVGNDRTGQFLFQRRKQGIVAVYHQRRILCHAVLDLQLCLADALLCLEVFNVRIADVGDYADARLCRPGKAADLAEVGHSHFNDSCLVAVLQPEQGLGETDLVVEVSLGFQGGILGFQHAGDHLLGGRLSHTAGDAHQRGVELLPIKPCNLQQRSAGMLYHQARTALDGLFRDRSHSPCLDRLFHEIVRIELFSTQRHEQTALRQVTGIGADAGDLCLCRHITAQHIFQF